MKVLMLWMLVAATTLRAAETIDDEARAKMAAAAARAIEVMYIEEDVAPKLAAETRRRMLSDAYRGLTPQEFVKKLTADLQEQTGDGHLYARYREAEAALPVPADIGEVDRTIESLRQMMNAGPGGGPQQQRGVAAGASALTTADTYRKMNWGLIEARVMEGNVGLLRIDRFAFPVGEAREAAIAAMAMVANTDALIIDLRNAPGGAETMATFLLSYFFAEERKPLISAHFRYTGRNVDSFTSPDVPVAKRRPDVPLYVLTSKQTFSAAEFFSYTLQKFGRATVVGETTGGGGYAGQIVPLGRGIFLSISVGKPVHPVTKSGWQKVGVIPDVAASRDDALRVAHEAARKRVG